MGGGNNPWRDEGTLRDLYIEQEKSAYTIADELGCSAGTVYRWLGRHGIETRDHCGANKIEKLRDKDWLYEQYVEKDRTTVDIGEELGTDHSPVSSWLKKHGIDTGYGSYTDCSQLRDREWLYEQYVTQEKTQREIADDIGCSVCPVSKWINKHGIEARTSTHYDLSDKRLLDAEWLREQYFEKGLNTVQIAAELGCSQGAVSTWFKEHGIDTGAGPIEPVSELRDGEWLREQYVGQEKSTGQIASELGCGTTSVFRWMANHGIETRGDYSPVEELRDKAWLVDQYERQEKSMMQIAEELGRSPSTVIRWVERHGIEKRKIVGEHHPQWNPDRDVDFRYGPGWTEQKKEEVRESQDRRCATCGDDEALHLAEYGMRLHVHHIQKAVTFDDPQKRNAKENLVALCSSCHKRWEKISPLVPETPYRNPGQAGG